MSLKSRDTMHVPCFCAYCLLKRHSVLLCRLHNLRKFSKFMILLQNRPPIRLAQRVLRLVPEHDLQRGARDGKALQL